MRYPSTGNLEGNNRDDLLRYRLASLKRVGRAFLPREGKTSSPTIRCEDTRECPTIECREVQPGSTDVARDLVRRNHLTRKRSEPLPTRTPMP